MGLGLELILGLVLGFKLVLGLVLGLMPSSDIAFKSTVLSSSCVPLIFKLTTKITKLMQFVLLICYMVLVFRLSNYKCDWYECGDVSDAMSGR